MGALFQSESNSTRFSVGTFVGMSFVGGGNYKEPPWHANLETNESLI